MADSARNRVPASRAHRIGSGRSKGQRSSDRENPARWRGHLDKLLPRRQQITRGHHAALPYPDVPGFISELRAIDAMAARALEFAVLTAARSGEVLGARWDEIDLQVQVWTIPPARTKSGREHRVPLSGRAVEIIAELAKVKTGDFIFQGQLFGRPLSNTSMKLVLRRMKVEATVHGFARAFEIGVATRRNFRARLPSRR